MMSNCKQQIIALLLTILPLPLLAMPEDVTQLCQWRSKLERIYHDSRLPPKKSFDEEFPPVVIQNLVAADLHKEWVLEKLYSAKVPQEMLKEEIQRIERDTKDAAALTRIKTSLGPDELGFAETVAKPIIVERLLRLKFYQDKAIHAAEREKAIFSRRSLEADKKLVGTEVQTWLLGDRPIEASATTPNIQPSTANSSAPSYSNQATAQLAQVIGGAGQEQKDTKQYFSDLDPELAAVLKKHLEKPGDVSPIIESTSGFSIYQAREMTADHWKVEVVFIPRISYDDWIKSQAALK